jgi:hypothetical protein
VNFSNYKRNGICAEDSYINQMTADTHQKFYDAGNYIKLLVNILKTLLQGKPIVL